jgi:molybdenum cofactor cytidylyltransferase
VQPVNSTISALVLAAGKSTRMGRPKATLPLDGTDTFLSRIVRTLQQAQIDDVVVVLGYDAHAVERSLAETGVSAQVVINEEYEAGQLSSLIAGLAAIDRPSVEAMLLTLVDVPLVSVATVRAVIERYRATGAPIVRPVRAALHGHPVLIDRSLFETIRSADTDRGVKPVVREHASWAGDVEVEDPGAFMDVDTPADYKRVLAELRGSGF